MFEANDAKAVSESVVPCDVQRSLQACREECTIYADNALSTHSLSPSASSSQIMCQASSADAPLAPLFPKPLTENDDKDAFFKVTTLIRL